MRTFLIGGSRCGKSSLACQWAGARSHNVCVLVTANDSDPEMTARIEAHQRERPSHWRVREEPLRLGRALREEASRGQLVLIDCLTLWISHCLWSAASPSVDTAQWQRERSDFLAGLDACTGEVIVVSNEVGSGIVPDNLAARIFRDEQGWLNQAVASACDEAFLVCAGLALPLKSASRTQGAQDTHTPRTGQSERKQ